MVHISCCCCTVRGYGKREAICWSLPRLPKQGKQKKPRSGLWNVPRRYPTESSDDLDWVVGYWIWMDLGVRITLMVQSLAYQMRLGVLCFSGSPGHCLSSSNLRNICQICQIDSSIWQERIQLLEEVVDIFFVDLQLQKNQKSSYQLRVHMAWTGATHKPLHFLSLKRGATSSIALEVRSDNWRLLRSPWTSSLMLLPKEALARKLGRCWGLPKPCSSGLTIIYILLLWRDLYKPSL